MKVINYDFENIGGLLQMIAIPPTSFLRIRKDYNTGLNYLELRNREDIISIPVYANDTYIYNEDKEVNDAGDCWNVSIEGVIPKLSSVNHDGDAGAWFVVCAGGGRQWRSSLVWTRRRTYAVRHEQDKRTRRFRAERNVFHVHLCTG